MGTQSIGRPKDVVANDGKTDEMYFSGNIRQRRHKGRLTGWHGGMMHHPYATTASESHK